MARPVCKGFSVPAFFSLLQRIRLQDKSRAKMEIRAIWSS